MKKKSGAWRSVLAVLVTVLSVGGAYFLGMVIELFGQERDPGTITGAPLPSVLVQAREAEQQAIARRLAKKTKKQNLYGDLHVHTTN